MSFFKRSQSQHGSVGNSYIQKAEDSVAAMPSSQKTILEQVLIGAKVK